ncbi:spore germination protein [Paenibacillus sp. GCM10023248]|uniref:spore germination protein n=1 Tax=unclassified Paenibacillus TaxID=185978 RepID=UPI0023793C2E|nr:spore germination protein [Paenibacillus sp. MAHUQ-63]MDD9267414.1 spore germination protein [Paenibacillus sp. MAHUQ-63]
MNGELTTDNDLLKQTLLSLQDCSDLTCQHFPLQQISIVYFAHLISLQALNEIILKHIEAPVTDITAIFSQSFFMPGRQAHELVNGILAGSIAIFLRNDAYLYEAYAPESRTIESSETESVINGPMDAFTESVNTNLSLIRRRIKDPQLKTVSFAIGKKTKTTLVLLYLEDVADPQHLEKLKVMIERLQIPAISDTNTLTQYFSMRSYMIFPQYLTSVRPDHMTEKLLHGKIVGLLDGSPFAFSAPTSFIEFFLSPDDGYQPWAVATAVRLLRFIALFITLTFTAFYVSLVTYHYEMIPPSLLLNLMESRNKVPFSPLVEAIFMEMTIELLREAGARLPTKIGPTIGTVGGIVIGQAAVQAGVTSNILIISVAISAIASFAIPSYIMSASIRLMRFGIIIMAGFLGNFGLICGICFIMIQLADINTFGVSYLFPLAPAKPSRWLDMIIRAPVQVLSKIKKTASENPNE